MITDPNRQITEKRLFEVLARLFPSADVVSAFEPVPPPPQVPVPIAPVPPRNWDPAIARVELQSFFGSEEIGLLRKLIGSDSTGALTDAEIFKIQERARRK
jgi:hypothetical protein